MTTAAGWRWNARSGVRHDIFQDTVRGANHPNHPDRGLQLSRACRASKIWMSVQTFGMAAFRRAVGNGMELASRAEAYIRESPVPELSKPASRPCASGSTPATWTNRRWRRSTATCSRECSGKTARSCHRRRCTGRWGNHNTTWDDVRETLEANQRFGTEALRNGK